MLAFFAPIQTPILISTKRNCWAQLQASIRETPFFMLVKKGKGTWTIACSLFSFLRTQLLKRNPSQFYGINPNSLEEISFLHWSKRWLRDSVNGCSAAEWPFLGSGEPTPLVLFSEVVISAKWKFSPFVVVPGKYVWSLIIPHSRPFQLAIRGTITTEVVRHRYPIFGRRHTGDPEVWGTAWVHGKI